MVRTPLERSATLGSNVWFKLECFQSTGSFKLRGAINALLQLPKQHGVVTASAGNHGLGVARAAELLGIQATVVVPETASPVKVHALQRSGATLLQHGPTYDEAEAHAIKLSKARALHYVSAYNDADVIAGGGTIALEILEDLPDARTFVVPAGGGGLISGIGIAAHGIDPSSTVFGVQSEASPALQAAHQAGHYVEVEVQPSLADGLSGNVERDSVTLDFMRQHVQEIVLVTEDAIANAMRHALFEEHLLIEGSAATGIAALQSGLISTNEPTVIVLTGRNVAAAVLRQCVRGPV